MVVVITTIFLPIALFWFLALWYGGASGTQIDVFGMTEVAVRLPSPIAPPSRRQPSLGQAVRRQVSFMNDAISRALGRAARTRSAGAHEVAALEKSYGEKRAQDQRPDPGAGWRAPRPRQHHR
jgi:hypothetical protein